MGAVPDSVTLAIFAVRKSGCVPADVERVFPRRIPKLIKKDNPDLSWPKTTTPVRTSIS